MLLPLDLGLPSAGTKWPEVEPGVVWRAGDTKSLVMGLSIWNSDPGNVSWGIFPHLSPERTEPSHLSCLKLQQMQHLEPETTGNMWALSSYSHAPSQVQGILAPADRQVMRRLLWELRQAYRQAVPQ